MLYRGTWTDEWMNEWINRCDKAALDRSIFKTSAVAKWSTYDLLLQGQDLYKHTVPSFGNTSGFGNQNPENHRVQKKNLKKSQKKEFGSFFFKDVFWLGAFNLFLPTWWVGFSVRFLRCGDNSEERDGSTQMRFNRLSNWTMVECNMLHGAWYWHRCTTCFLSALVP